jgi:hypothetical protein
MMLPNAINFKGQMNDIIKGASVTLSVQTLGSP